MAIVKMKRLRVMAMESDRDRLFDELQRLGCVQVSEQTEKLTDPDWAALVHRDESALAASRDSLDAVTAAISVLDRYAPQKTGLLSPLPLIGSGDLYDGETLEKALKSAEELRSKDRSLGTIRDEIQKEQSFQKTMEPWLKLDIPLNTRPSGALYTAFGMIPSGVDLEAVRRALAEKAEASSLEEASTDSEMHYVFLMCHKAEQEDALDALKAFGFSPTVFRDIDVNAREAWDASQARKKDLEGKREALEQELTGQGSAREPLELAYDRLSQDIQKETCKERLLAMDRTFFLDGWVSEPDADKLENLLKTYDCAYELRDPAEEEYPDVPIRLKNGPLTRCMNVVTEMYSLPAYDGLDPNPLMAPFFILFFGMMMADMAYGLLMIAAALVVLKVKRPREGTRNFMELVLYCGIATFVFGALTGGFFGDFIPQLAKIINPNSTFTMPALFTPLNDTVAILLGSLVLGAIQVFTGMAISVVKKTMDGHFADALWDEITWWVILVGIGLAVLKIGTVGSFPLVLVLGCIMLAYGSTRNAKGFGKLAAFVAAVYNGVTGFFSDILSYLRLMALMLSGSVIAQVFNTLGAVFGSVVPFILISMVGNAMNLALNLLGCYVHDLRLQCLEYFGRFYKEGGKPCEPLSIQTTYHDIIKEEP